MLHWGPLMRQLATALSAIALFYGPYVAAQDSRTVTEPVLPPICSSLDAQLSVNGHSLAQADETKLDTARIQQALSEYGSGSETQT